jgi:tyrosyl-tRNA synthetase
MTRDVIVQVLESRGFVQQISDEVALQAHLEKGPATFYVGFDPTAPSLHVGSLVPLMAMAHLAREGHRPIAVLGGGTSMVGDPSGRTELRKMMTLETIAANRQAIEPQVRRVLAAAGDSVIVVDNAEWLAPLNYWSSCATSAATSASTGCWRPRPTSSGWKRGCRSSSSTTRSCRPTTSWC